VVNDSTGEVLHCRPKPICTGIQQFSLFAAYKGHSHCADTRLYTRD